MTLAVDGYSSTETKNTQIQLCLAQIKRIPAFCVSNTGLIIFTKELPKKYTVYPKYI